MLIDELDREFLKFLWFNKDQTKILTFQFKLVLFGAKCSPYLLQEILQTHFSSNILGHLFIIDKFYVDYYMNTYQRECDIINEKPQLEELMLQANMHLQELVSNNGNFNRLYRLKVSRTQNVLGIEWEPLVDKLRVTPGEKLMSETTWKFMKRKVLFLMSSLFGPLGLLSLLGIRGRIFLQSL